MAASVPVTLPIRDDVYERSLRSAPVDQDTIFRSASYRESADSRGTIASPLNSTGRKTVFEFNQGTASKIRWGGMALRLTINISNAGNAMALTGGQPKQAPDWNMVGRLIRQVKLEVNTGKELYSSSDGRFLEEFTAQILHNHTWQELKHNEDMLFLPMDDDQYAFYNAGAVSAGNGCTAWLARGLKYCNVDSHLKPFTKVIPFLDLFPRMPDAVFRNLHTMRITITWEGNTDILSANGNDYTGRVYLLKADILEDYYALEPTTSIVETEQKVETQQPDIIPMLVPMVRTFKYTQNMQITIPGVKNLESVMLFQFAANQSNGAAGAEARTHRSWGQFKFVSNAMGDSFANTMKTADAPAITANNNSPGITSIGITYNGRPYPQQAILVGQAGVGADFAQLYYEYKKALNRFGHLVANAAIPYYVFKPTMPFLFLNPFATDAPKLTTNADLVITTTSGTVDANAPDIVVVYFQYQVAKLEAGGTITFAVQ